MPSPPARTWHRALLALAAGALATLAFAPYHIVPALLPAFAGLLWLIGRGGWRGRVVVGWAFGFGYFLAGLHWVGQAFLVEADRFAWLMPVAVAALPAGLALFPAAAAGVAGLAGGPLRRLMAFAGAWTLAEWLRGWVLTGFPWNQAGDVWAVLPAVAQPAALVGGLGLTLLTVAAAAAPALFAMTGWRRALLAVALPWALLAAGAGWGAWRMTSPPPDTEVRLRVVQPNVPQALKWRLAHRMPQLQALAALSAGAGDVLADVVVWPETATPFLFAHDHDLRRQVTAALPEGSLLLTGAPRVLEGTGGKDFRNSLHAVDRSGRIIASYDKHHLVPFGEYVPLRRWLRRLGIERLAAGRGDFGPGPGQALLFLPGLPPLQPLICYEVIFAAEIGGAGRPGWLLNATNDAWFGDSAGPYQHFAMARLRAIERGVPLVRVANTGISGVIDAFGRVRHRLALGTQGAIEAVLPGALARPTPFDRVGHLPVLGGALALLVLALTGGRRAQPT